uniref:HMA domain-containing protein n=1 Tax=Solanum lycopersicum TaxID=4081 RepID=A0A3Q7EZF0_SOLLC|nr:heavy metal-associated isoprenylated plant protein 36 isoform X2 [Solanum lycopersicum]
MASSPPDQEQQPPQFPPLHYRTWVLKVSIHCPGCKRKVKKVLQSIEGVYTTDIDPQQQKVIVTGNVEAETLIKKLIRNGRSAELWPEPKPILKEKKPKKNENSEDDDDDHEDDEHNNNNNNEKPAEHGPPRHGVRFGGVETFTMDVKEVRPDERPPENIAVVERFPAPEQKAGGGGGAKKKKKKKKKKSSSGNNNANPNASAGSNGAPPGSESDAAKMGPNQMMDQANQGHSNQHPYPNPCDQHPHASYYVPQQHQSYIVSYNAAHPMVSSAPAYYYVPSSPYMQSDIYSKQQCTPLDSFEILSDENPHACYIM